MRSFTIVLLLALVLAVAAFAPVASAGANITLYADLFCSQVLGDGPLEIPIPSATTCQDVSGPSGAGSAVFWCYNTAGYNNLSLAIWTTASDCSGQPDISVGSYAKQDSCAVVSLNFGGQTAPAFGKVDCSASMDGAAATGPLPVNALIGAAKRAVSTRGAKGAARNMMMPRIQKLKLNA